jgi:copper chaperone CopZ
MKVRIDCEGCERKIRKALEGMKGTEHLLFSACYLA